MKHIPFTPEEEASIGGAGTWMTVAAVVSIVSLVFSLFRTAVQTYFALETEAAMPQLVGGACGGVIGVVLTAIFAVWLFLGGRDLKRVVTTNEDDQAYLVAAIHRLRQVFALKAVLILSLVVLVCLGVILGAGAAAALSSR